MANLPNLTPRLLQNTLKLIKLYNTNPKFRELFDKLVPNPKVTYQGQPLKLYLRVITTTSTKYRRYEKEVRADPEKFKELLIFFYKDPQGFSKFEKMVQASILGKYVPTFLTPEETELINRIEQNQEEKEKGQLINQLEQRLKASQPKEEVPKVEKVQVKREVKLPQVHLPQITLPKPQLPKLPQPPHLALPQIKFPSFTKDLFSQGQILARKAIYKFGANIFSGGVGGVVAVGLGGGPGGILAGTGLGAIFPTALKNSGILRGGMTIGGKAVMGLGFRGAALATGPAAPVLLAASFTPQASSLAKKAFATTRMIAIAIVAGVSLFFFTEINKINSVFPPFGNIGEAAPIPSGYVGSGGCPDTSSNRNGFSCRYLNPAINIFDTNISQEVIDTYVKNYSSIFISAKVGDLNEFKRRVDYIVEKSKQGKLNPAIFLGYWKTESLFSTMGSRDMGCVGNNFYEQVRCALAIDDYANLTENPVANCARSESADSAACAALKSIRSSFDKTHPINYPIRTFDDFAESYGPYDHLSGGQPTNCISTYNKLIDVAKELGACKSVPVPIMSPPQKEFALSCPINNEYNTCSNKSDYRDPCHCNPALGYDPISMQACKNFPALEYGIDVGTKASKTALIPFITYQGDAIPQSLNCELITEEPPTCPVTGSCEWQQTLRYQCPMKDNTLYLLYSHIKSNPGKHPQNLSSGGSVGEVANYGHGLRRLNIQVGVGGECSGTVVSTCKSGGDYFQCPLKKDYVLDY